MVPELFSGQSPSSWQYDVKLSQVEVVVCTATHIFAGHTYRSHQQRLLDVLNRGFVADSSRIGRDFVPLTEVEVLFPSKRKESMAFTYIRKASVLFVAEKNGGQAAEPGIKDEPKICLWRAKKPIGAKVYMPLYTLAGKMHGEMRQQLLDILNRDEIFLPLTNVEISSELVSGEARFNFVAINKDQIIYIGESPE